MKGLGSARLSVLLGGLPEGRGPAYRRLSEGIRLLVGDGRLAAGSRLPAERDLAVALGCSRATVTRAYAGLRETGWAGARQGAGTWTRLPSGPRSPAGAWVPGPGHDGTIDLAHAAPEAPPQLADAVHAAVEALPREYGGHGYDPAGMLALRARIAERYTRRGLPTTPEQIVVTHGALHGVATTMATVLGPGDRVLVEHPTYPSALDALSDAGGRPVTVPVAPEPGARGEGGGPAVDLCRAARQTTARLAYLVPDFHNPTGALLGDQERARLAPRLARLGVLAVVDETFAELALDGAEPPRPYAAHAPDDAVVTVGSLSKVVWGGLRLGWARAAPELAAALRRRIARTELAPPVMEQLVGVALFDVLDEIGVQRRGLLRARRDAAVALLAQHLPGWRVPVPAGGLALWCDLGAPISSALAARAPDAGVRVAAGPRFGTGHAFDDRLRVPFTHPEPVLARAIDRLARAAEDLGGARPPETGDELVV